MAAAGIAVHHPRKSLFHMTLARVTPAYPTDAVVAKLRGTRFGTHRLCSFEFDGATIEADDCKHSAAPQVGTVQVDP